MNLQTPFFVINQEELQTNIDDFKIGLNRYWPNSIFSYSVKTNSLPWVLEYMLKNDIMAEVVSDEEYQLSKLCGFMDDEIIYNGPIKGHLQLEQAIKGNAIINIDSEKELDYVLNNANLISDNIGIRVNVPTNIFKKEDIGYEEEGFRFGFSEYNGRLEEVINSLKSKGIKRFGLHFHVNSVSRSLDVYRAIAQYAKYIIEQFVINPSYIDIGGGFFGGLPEKPSPQNYIEAVRKELENVVDINTTKLIIEPGSAVIGSCVELHSTVLDTKELENVHIVTTDASRIHIDPLWKKKNYFYRIERKKEEAGLSYKDSLICGYTCMDHDRIMKIQTVNDLNVGDRIIFEKVGAYSITLGGPFIRYYPTVLVNDGNDLIVIRDSMNVEDYFKNQKAKSYRRIKSE